MGFSYGVIAVDSDRIIEFFMFPSERKRKLGMELLERWNDDIHFRTIASIQHLNQQHGHTSVAGGHGINVLFAPGISCPKDVAAE